jgi:hypothetical protein
MYVLCCCVQVKTFHDTDFLKTLELAIQYGFPFLFEGCDEYIDPIIDPVLERSLVGAPGSKQVRRRFCTNTLLAGPPACLHLDGNAS